MSSIIVTVPPAVVDLGRIRVGSAFRLLPVVA